MRNLLAILIIIFSYTLTKAQINKANAIGAYLYNFAKLSSSPKQNQLSTYPIVVVSNNQILIEEFKKMAQNNRINDKPIQLTIDNNASGNYHEACLLFISSDMNQHYRNIFNQTKNDEVLLVSEDYDDKTHIMLNLYEAEDHTMKFEMNKGNIYDRNITISDEILLMGGNIVDLTELYIETQKELQSSDSKIEVIEDSLSTLSSEIGKNQQQIAKQDEALEQQKEIISKQKQEQQKLTSNISEQKQQLISVQDAFTQNEAKMRLYNDSLIHSREILQSFQNQIAENNQILQDQQNEIKTNKEVLSQKNTVIRKQRIVVAFFVVGITVNIALLILLLKSLKDKKRKNKQLRKQKEELAKQNKVLEKNSNLIESMMDELSDNNEELTTMLEENKRMQNKLVQSEKMASLGVLSAGIAHEINNPINFVYAGINSLLRDFEDIKPVIDEVSKLNVDNNNLNEKIELIKKLKEENYFDEAMEAIPEIISDIKLGADRTAEIVKGLRNFTHMDSDNQEKLNINEGLDTSLLLLKNKYKNHIEIIKDYSQSIPDILCFPGKINQALLNILANAVDAIKDKGTIWITTNHTDVFLEISIKDDGHGIPKEIQNKIFDPFFTTKSVGEGTGLGLAITFGIIGEHNGTIEVNSKEGEGTEFIIQLPIQ